jgi:hypothetical protein
MITINDVMALFTPMEPDTFADHRIKICQECDSYRAGSMTCDICNCIMPLKARMPSMKCPAGKWQQEGGE